MIYYHTITDSWVHDFVGGRKIPTWAIGFSIIATSTSGFSFIAIPAKSYMTNLLFFGAILISQLFAVAMAFLMPYLRRLNITTIYEYLEARFDLCIRLFGAAVYVIYQAGLRMSVAMYIPALAIAVVTGIDVVLCILIMGVLATIYTYLGGGDVDSDLMGGNPLSSQRYVTLWSQQIPEPTTAAALILLPALSLLLRCDRP